MTELTVAFPKIANAPKKETTIEDGVKKIL
jgi:hypothetical protein